ncbi:translation initiation factor IF-2 [Leucothrix arctica]|uniref:Translation initiation factor IF-2 n=1 Tax=Leucothrix arctica TaxID=1481894 RepID=A0A317CK89_9GAMM|nr:translation initiation factor IF-2 [Leucothrix arctica]PWQ99015.1 translation initiation factor IF-2 [Leucothrix arctica]
MSEITVKKLSEMVGAPVETLLQQMQDAGIHVKGADDSITDRQKLDLLEHIRTSTGTVEDTQKTGKITLKKRSNNELKLGGAGKDSRTVNVEVRRKKTILRKNTTAAPIATDAPAVESAEPTNAGTSRAEELGKELEAERKVREQAVIASREKAAKKAAPAKEAIKETEVVAEAPKAVDTPLPAKEATPSPEKVVEVPVATKPVEKKTEKPAEKAKPTPAADIKPTEEKPLEATPAKAKVSEEKVDVKADDKTESTTDTPAKPTLTVNKSKPEDQLDANGLPKDPKLRRAAVAAKARAEAAAIFKKRPSRVKPKPVVAPTPVKPVEAAKPAAAKAAPAKPATPAKPAEKAKKKPFQGRANSAPLNIKGGNGGRGGANRKGGKGRRGQRRNEPTVDQSTEHGFEKPTAPVIREVEIPETIVVSELALQLAVKGADIIRAMMGMGVMATINQALDQDTAILIVEEMGHKGVPVKAIDEESQVADLIENLGDFELHARPPVVTIMGHVDHGKTSLLDYIRTTRVASGEAGGITQHIGAYHVETDNGIVSFLDTPGHAAFTAMRARGAKATDIVILVVAADDGVMPQTKEAIEHTRASGVPLIVAINKIDKEGADPEKVKTELSNFGVIGEDWGGEDIFCNVSAKTGQGVPELLEAILLVAELQELKARTDGPAQGLVIESRLEKGRGAVSTVLVQQGTLKRGDMLLAGAEYGRIRAMINEDGKPVEEVGPSIPVEILGLSGTPSAGEPVMVMGNERKAREIAEKRHNKERETRFAAQQAAKLDEMFSKMRDGEKSALNVLLKTDVHGSLEALRDSLNKLSTDEVVVKIVSSGVGGISETDIALAQAADAVVMGFNVRADVSARRIASEAGIELRYYSIIYELIDDVRDALSGLLKPELREEMTGLAEVKGVFKGSGFGAIAGCLVTEGVVKKGNPIRVLRDNVVIFEGELESLRRHQEDVNDVRMGTECGIGVKNYDDVQEGDQIEIYTRTIIERTLEK